MLIEEIATEIYNELAEPEDISVSSIVFWIQSNYSSFGNLINLDIIINEDGTQIEVTPAQKDILKAYYGTYYFQRQINKNLGAAAYSSIAEIREGDVSVRRTSKTEIAKNYTAALKDLKGQLDLLIIAYKNRTALLEQVIIGDNCSVDIYGLGPQSILSWTRNI